MNQGDAFNNRRQRRLHKQRQNRRRKPDNAGVDSDDEDPEALQAMHQFPDVQDSGEAVSAGSQSHLHQHPHEYQREHQHGHQHGQGLRVPAGSGSTGLEGYGSMQDGGGGPDGYPGASPASPSSPPSPAQPLNSSAMSVSAMEYSDTSDDYYFQADAKTRIERGQRATLGESTFRQMRDASFCDSSRIVRIGSSSPSNRLSPTSHFDRNSANLMAPDPSTPIIYPPPADPYNHMHANASINGSMSDNNGSFRSWISNLAYSFRSPARQEERHGSGLSGIVPSEMGGLATRPTHRHQLSSATMEYPYRVSPDPDSKSSMTAYGSASNIRSIYAGVGTNYPTVGTPVAGVGGAGLNGPASNAATANVGNIGNNSNVNDNSSNNNNRNHANNTNNQSNNGAPTDGNWETSPLLAIPTLPSPRTGYVKPEDAQGSMYANANAHLHKKDHPLHAADARKSNGGNTASILSSDKHFGDSHHQASTRSVSLHDIFEDEPSKSHFTQLSLGKATIIAAYFLKDYEAGRPPTMSQNFHYITPSQLQLYRICMSWTWRWLGLSIAILLLFYAHTQNRLLSAWLHTWAIVIFIADIRMRDEIRGSDHVTPNAAARASLIRPMILFLVLLGLESWFWYVIAPHDRYPQLLTALFKPLVFFYVSSKAQEACEAVWRIGGIVSRVLLIEVFLILGFAAVACRMFHGYASFENLSMAWLSLFELSTTVINPSLWMPMYKASRTSAFFFVFFIVVAVFYLHSLVLSVVFQTYIQAASEIHARPAADREEAIRLSFAALAAAEFQNENRINVASVRKTLQIVRPHYSSAKVKALVDIIDPDHVGSIDYATFRTKIRQALNASIRTSRSNSTFAMVTELIAVVVAVLNFIYVVLLTSAFEAVWFDQIILWAGSVITILGFLELIIRFNPLRCSNFAPITRLNSVFDGLAFCAALVSLYGIGLFWVESYGLAVDYILLGRAIDMIRVMRFFPIFRDVVRRSSDVFPALAGPLFLMLTCMHIFVYFGMVLWGGAIDTEVLATNMDLTPLYYLNNFNSYGEGLVAFFNIIVMNDWPAMAEVFLYADRFSSPFIVYPFFVVANLVAVSIMLNLITAFFVGSFVTKLDDLRSDGDDINNNVPNLDRDFRIQTSERPVTKIASVVNLASKMYGRSDENDDGSNHSGTPKSITARDVNRSDVLTFDVYEREGYDRIMKTVAGMAEESEAFAASVCDYLEIFENLAPGREKIGYVVCCQQTKTRFGNRRFQAIGDNFIDSEVLYQVVGDMHTELLALTSSRAFADRSLVRMFRHRTDPSQRMEISASLLRQTPAVSLLVARAFEMQETASNS